MELFDDKTNAYQCENCGSICAVARNCYEVDEWHVSKRGEFLKALRELTDLVGELLDTCPILKQCREFISRVKSN